MQGSDGRSRKLWLHNPPPPPTHQKSSMSKWQILANSLWCWPIGWPSAPSANVKTMFKLWTMPSSVWSSQSHSYLDSMSPELHQVTRETQTSLSSIVRMHVNKLKDVFFLHAGPIWPCQGCTEGAEHCLFFWAFLSSYFFQLELPPFQWMQTSQFKYNLFIHGYAAHHLQMEMQVIHSNTL